ncbi:MAG TPA: AMP-binding protein, partial [Thiotrichales bacterium]|nr:AMP-binding protein [Thiotrichales bacterium]
MSNNNIESVLHENRLFTPSERAKAEANVNAEQLSALHAEANADHVAFWSRLAKEKLQWSKPFTVGLDDSKAPHYRWFTDGELNVSVNCLDRHLDDRGDKTAIIFEGEPGDVQKYTYHELHGAVCRFANALKVQGVQTGDRVIIYMPMIPEAVIAMQACARIGAIHSIVFGGFSAEALKDRVEDAQA